MESSPRLKRKPNGGTTTTIGRLLPSRGSASTSGPTSPPPVPPTIVIDPPAPSPKRSVSPPQTLESVVVCSTAVVTAPEVENEKRKPVPRTPPPTPADEQGESILSKTAVKYAEPLETEVPVVSNHVSPTNVVPKSILRRQYSEPWKSRSDTKPRRSKGRAHSTSFRAKMTQMLQGVEVHYTSVNHTPTPNLPQSKVKIKKAKKPRDEARVLEVCIPSSTNSPVKKLDTLQETSAELYVLPSTSKLFDRDRNLTLTHTFVNLPVTTKASPESLSLLENCVVVRNCNNAESARLPAHTSPASSGAVKTVVASKAADIAYSDDDGMDCYESYSNGGLDDDESSLAFDTEMSNEDFSLFGISPQRLLRRQHTDDSSSV